MLISVIVAGLAMLAFAGAKSEFKALAQQWSDAYAKGDSAVLKAIEAEDFKLVDPDGKVLTKAQEMKGLAGETFLVESFS